MSDLKLFNNKSFLNIRGELYSLNSPKVMGILNITDDSFYDGGKYTNTKLQLKRVETMLREGADFIDIGAQSTRPGSKEVGKENELELIIPALKEIRREFPETIISVDTWHSSVAKAVADEGADMINDISGGQFDNEMFNTIAQIQLPYILMHTGGRPDAMQNNPTYKNVVKDIIYFMSEQIDRLNQLGVNDIIVDPGFGFGKTQEHNFELMKNLNHFSFLETPLLVGVSRKSMVCKTLNVDPIDALNGTTALHMYALNKGAGILRVHDVKEAKECIEIYKMI